jgi:hypothetical protein
MLGVRRLRRSQWQSRTCRGLVFDRDGSDDSLALVDHEVGVVAGAGQEEPARGRDVGGLVRGRGVGGAGEVTNSAGQLAEKEAGRRRSVGGPPVLDALGLVHGDRRQLDAVALQRPRSRARTSAAGTPRPALNSSSAWRRAAWRRARSSSSRSSPSSRLRTNSSITSARSSGGSLRASSTTFAAPGAMVRLAPSRGGVTSSSRRAVARLAHAGSPADGPRDRCPGPRGG